MPTPKKPPPKPAKKPQKRGPKEERLVITEDPATALARLFTPANVSRTRKAKAKFDAAHKAGMDALRRKDYKAMDDAIQREAQAIDALPKPKPAPKK
jgi:hypothetical protein